MNRKWDSMIHVHVHLPFLLLLRLLFCLSLLRVLMLCNYATLARSLARLFGCFSCNAKCVASFHTTTKPNLSKQPIDMYAYWDEPSQTGVCWDLTTFLFLPSFLYSSSSSSSFISFGLLLLLSSTEPTTKTRRRRRQRWMIKQLEKSLRKESWLICDLNEMLSRSFKSSTLLLSPSFSLLRSLIYSYALLPSSFYSSDHF